MAARPLKPVETEAVPLAEVLSRKDAELLAGHGVSLGLARLRDGRWVAAVPMHGLRFKGRADRDAALAAAKGPLRALAKSLAAAAQVAPPADGSLESEVDAYLAARAVAVEIPELAQGLPLALSAEIVERCPRGRTFRSDAEISRYVDQLTSSTWWRRRYPHVAAVRVLRAAARRKSMEEAYAGLMTMRPRRDGTAGWDLSIQEGWRYELVVLHELAHAVIPPPAGYDHHGPEWLRAWVTIVDRQLGAPVAEHLTWLFAQHDRRPAGDDDMDEAVRFSRRLIRDAAAVRRIERNFTKVQQSWRWRFNEELALRGREAGIWSDRQIISACRRADDRTVTMASLRSLRDPDGTRTRRAPADLDARRIARRVLVVLGSGDEALAARGLSPRACRLVREDLDWEAQRRAAGQNE